MCGSFASIGARNELDKVIIVCRSYNEGNWGRSPSRRRPMGVRRRSPRLWGDFLQFFFSKTTCF